LITSIFLSAINHILRAELHGFSEQERSIRGRKTASASIAYNDASEERFGPGGAAYSRSYNAGASATLVIYFSFADLGESVTPKASGVPAVHL
jgi:hypothetical protein